MSIEKKNIHLRMVAVFTVSLAIFLGVLLRSFGTSLFVNAAERNRDYTVVIDPGHGGEDCGAIGKSGVYEKDLNLVFSRLIGDMLEERSISVVYTRTDDKMLYSAEENVKGLRKISDLKNRVKIAVEYPECIFISVHMNSFGDERYSGLQVYYSPNSADSRFLAESVQSSVRESVQTNNKRAVKNGKELYLMKNITSAAVLIECGFLSNRAECEKLSEKEYQKLLSFSIVCGIIKYIEEKNIREK